METNLFRYVWQKSRGEQIAVLMIILASIPFNWISFDVPKRIVNDAIQGGAFKDGKTTTTLMDLTIHLPGFVGGGSISLFEGFQVGQLGLLFGLSLYFLALVLINGAFKFVINLRKGILGERMLRRMRYDLFSQLMRFRPEEMRAVKPAEVASMIKDEVEPIGGFVGDAFIQPVFLLSQALTALVFIMAQSVWLGSIALFIVVAQAIIIPILRKEQLRLGRERQLASRQLAGRIGEVVDAGPTIQGHGATAYVQSDIAARLGALFDIRYALYKRKFAVKFLNNLLAQITPFFFYAIGGYFALQGRLDIGQLVAVIAAYRDLPPPVKELIDWDQQRNDVTIKYEQVISQFNTEETLVLDEEEDAARLPDTGEIRLDGVAMLDNRGQPLLTPLMLRMPRPCVAAIIGPAGGGRDVLGRILGRQSMSYTGRVLIDRFSLSRLSVERASHLIGYAGHDSEIINGSLRDNILLPLKRHRPSARPTGRVTSEQHRRFIEALRSGNTPFSFDADWTDYDAVGASSGEALEAHVRAILDVLGVAEDVYELGLDGKLEAPLDERVRDSIIEARRAVSAELAKSKIAGLVQAFDPAHYNANASVAENLIFGTRRTARFANENLLGDAYARGILQAEALIEPLAEVGSRIVSTVAEIFEGLPLGHALFERYTFGPAFDLEKLNTLAGILAKHDMRIPLDPETERDLVALALGYIEPKHRLNLVSDALRQRLLRARASFKAHLPGDAAEDVEFYDAERIMHGASVRDNLLFGRIGFGVADAGRKVAKIVHTALERAGLENELYRLGLDTDCGIRGRYLPTRLRLAVPLAQALIKAPQIVVLDPSALLATTERAPEIVRRLREHCAGVTLFLLLSDASLAEDIALRIVFDGPTGVIDDEDADGGEAEERESVPPAAVAERMEARP